MQYQIGDTVIYKAAHNREYTATILSREIYFDKNHTDLSFTKGHFDYLIEYTLGPGISTTAFCRESDLVAADVNAITKMLS